MSASPDTHSHSAPASDPGSHGHAAHDMHLGLYLGIGVALLVLTGVTVALSYVDFDKMIGGHGWNMIIGMIVATFKVCLVAAIFMHLKGESKTVWRFIYFTLFFVAGLFLLTLLSHSDPIYGTRHNSHGEPQAPGTMPAAVQKSGL